VVSVAAIYLALILFGHAFSQCYAGRCLAHDFDEGGEK